MTAVLLFLAVVFTVGGWWLFQQGLATKPWLESGPGSVPDADSEFPMDRAKAGLFVFLTVVGALFALFASGFFMRLQYPDWRSLPMPPTVWINTGYLVLSSALLQASLKSISEDESNGFRYLFAAATFAMLAFLVGQVIAWDQLMDRGYYLTSNPANSFFYMITAVHGLHIIGGLVALARTARADHRGASADELRTSLELCTIYAHFLLFVWLVMLFVLVGWANDLFDICRQLLV